MKNKTKFTSGWYTTTTIRGQSNGHWMELLPEDDYAVSLCGMVVREPGDLSAGDGTDRCERCAGTAPPE